MLRYVTHFNTYILLTGNLQYELLSQDRSSPMIFLSLAKVYEGS